MAEANVPYTFTNGVGNTIDATEVNANFTNLEDAANDVVADQLASSVAEKVGVSQTGTVRRGKCIVATEETTTSASYTTLTTPDRVSSVVLPTDGLILVVYQALWKVSTGNGHRAAIHLGSNQLKVRRSGVAAPSEQAAAMDASSVANVYSGLSTCPIGLIAHYNDTGASSEVTTGQAVGIAGQSAATGIAYEVGGATIVSDGDTFSGGVCAVFAAAGTYDVSVRFKTSAGTLSAKERKLWAWTQAF